MAKEENKKVKKQDTPNKGHKHLFGSTEKSDFILNMDAKGAQKMCSMYIIISLIIVTVLAVPAYFTQTMGEYEVDGVTHYLSDNFIYYSAALVMLTGGVGYLIFNIARQKELVDIKANKLLLLPVLILIWSLVTCFTAIDLQTSFMGVLGRHEGFLTVLGCFGLFAVASAVSEEKRKTMMCDVIVGAGTFHAIVGILQYLPATAEGMHNFFEYLYVRPGTAPQAADEIYYDGGASMISGIYTHGRAATGFLITPHALAAVLTVAFALAVTGTAFDSSKKRKILYAIAAIPMAAAACFTQTITAIVGMGAAAAVTLALVLAKAFGKKTGSKGAFAGLIPIACAALIMGLLLTSGGVKQRDESIIFTDGYVLKSLTTEGRLMPSDTSNIYRYLFVDAELIASKSILFGTGCDNVSYVSDISSDRFYNEYMDMASQRGIIVVALYVIFLLVSLWKALKATAGCIKGECGWAGAAAFAAAVAYIAQAWVNTTWVTSNYYLFIVLGLAWGFAIRGKLAKT